MRTVDEVRDEIARRQVAAAKAFPDAEPEAFAFNLIQEALAGGEEKRTYADRFAEIQNILDAVKS